MSYTREFTSKAYSDFLLLKQALINAKYPEIQINLRLDSIVDRASTRSNDEGQVSEEGNPGSRSRHEYFGYAIQCAVDHDKQLVLIEQILLRE